MKNLPDLWEGCYADSHRQMSPEQFKKTFCDNCLNPGCVNSKAAGTSWMNRILTQEEVLLRNPLFANENDPLFSSLRSVDFKDLLQQALALEIADRKGDWSIPSQEEIQQEAAAMLHPRGFSPKAEEIVLPTPLPVEEEPLGVWKVKGDKNISYEVSQYKTKGWKCTCNAFKFSDPPMCKHIEMIQFRLTRSNQNPEAPTNTAPIVSRPPPIDVPLGRNTNLPGGGMMVGGGPPPPPAAAAPDPWAITEQKVSVGGRVVLKKDGE